MSYFRKTGSSTGSSLGSSISYSLFSLFIILLLVTFVVIPSSFSMETIDEGVVAINEESDYVEGVVIVQFDPNIDKKDKDKHKEELGLTLKKELKKPGLELLKLNKNKNVEEIVAKLNKKKDVLFAEPDYILRAIYDPDDYYFNLLWGLDNDDDIDIDAPEAWDIQMGDDSIIVAVIDTGIQTRHKDLKGQFVEGYDFYYNDTSVYDNPRYDDHGTHVAGTIAAKANDIGVIGVAPNVKIMPLKFLGPYGGSTSDAILAINYAKENGAHIINASWGGGDESDALKAAITSFGGPFVAAAGNSGVDTDAVPHYPSSYDCPNIISVAAIDVNGDLASFSNYGYNSVDVAAPGVSIASTYPNGYAYMSGTSMAAPHVAGIAALMLSQDPTLTTEELIGILRSTTVKLDSLDGKILTGGLVNAYEALNKLDATPPDETAPEFVTSDPENNDANVPINTTITVTFNEDVALSTSIIITLSENGEPVTDVNISVDETNKTKLIVDKPGDMLINGTYVLTIPAGSVKDLSDNLLIAEEVITFYTVSELQTVPVVFRTEPENRERNVELESIKVDDIEEYFIKVYFISGITELGEGAITITAKSGAQPSITKVQPTYITVESIQYIDYITIIIDELVPTMTYTVTLSEGALITSDGKLSETYSFKFTTIRIK